MRSLVAAAWHTSGLDRDESPDDLAARARASAFVPNLHLRVHRGLNVGARIYGTADAAPTSAALTDSTQTFVEARLTWRLDRLVFADEELALERLKLERAELKQKVAAKVIDLTFRWHRARRAAGDLELLPFEREEAALIAVESLLALDAYTGGEASKLLPK